ncbi:TniQ family protein [Streptomyces goshikiensis]|uniref:TniQ family protein n=1 Tax=Streptomyces goshikiensis TaxID=1942 RepID=UPI00364959F7
MEVLQRSRMLPRSLEPLTEESLPGYLLRLSHRLECSPIRMAKRLGLGEEHNRISSVHLRGLSPKNAAQFGHVARLAEHEATALTLSRFSATYPPLQSVRADTARIGGTALANWALAISSRFCPSCLAGDGSPAQNAHGGAWQLRWHLPVVIACPLHQRLLADRCPTCDLPVNSPEQGRPGLVKLPATVGLHPARCRNRNKPTAAVSGRTATGAFPSSEPCGTQLDSDDHDSRNTLPLADLDALLSLQQRVDRHLAPTAGTYQASDPHYFPDLIAVTHLIKVSWPVGRDLLPSEELADRLEAHAEPVVARLFQRAAGATPQSLSGTRTAPARSDICGALLLAADTALADRELRTLTERVEPLFFEASQRSDGYARSIMKTSGISADLRRACSPRAPNYRVRNRLRKQARTFTFATNEIPPLLSRELYAEYYTDLRRQLPDATYRDDRLLRRAASLRLVEMITGLVWPDCAPTLGVQPTTARYTLNALGHRFSRTPLWPAFADATNHVAEHLEQQALRADYHKRRKRMFSWRMPTEDWNGLFEELPRLQGSGVSYDVDLGTVIAWADTVHDDVPHSPLVEALRGTLEARRLTSHASAYNTKDLKPGSRLRLRRRVAIYARHIGEACDQDRPLTVQVDRVNGEEVTEPLLK